MNLYHILIAKCHVRDGNTENIMVGEIEEVNEEEDAISIEQCIVSLMGLMIKLQIQA